MFTLKNAKRVLFEEAHSDELYRQFNLPVKPRALPNWREIPAAGSSEVKVELPSPGKAGLYGLLISAGLGISEVFVYALRTAIFVAGKLAVWAGGLFLITLALNLWGIL